MDKRGLSFNTLLILLVFMLVGSSLLVIENGADIDKTLNIIKTTQNNTLSSFEINESNSMVVNVIYQYAYFLIYSTFEISRAVIQYSVANPGFVSPRNLLNLTILVLLIPVIYYVFLMCIVIFLLAREYVLIKKENKLKKRMRGEI